MLFNLQEQDLIRLKREAKSKNGFYVEPEAKVMFVIRIRGINDMHPKVRPFKHCMAVTASTESLWRSLHSHAVFWDA